MVCRGQASFLVSIADRAEVAADDFVICLELAIVGCLLEHAEVEVRWWGERAAGNEDERRPARIRKNGLEAISWEDIVVERHGLCRFKIDVEDGRVGAIVWGCGDFARWRCGHGDLRKCAVENKRVQGSRGIGGLYRWPVEEINDGCRATYEESSERASVRVDDAGGSPKPRFTGGWRGRSEGLGPGRFVCRDEVKDGGGNYGLKVEVNGGERQTGGR